MKKQVFIVFSVVVIIAILITSCNFPGKALVATQTPPPVLATTPPPPDPSSTETTVETPPPDAEVAPAEFIPVSGSVLTWIDYSTFIYVPAGEFIMGEEKDPPTDRSPEHKVSLEGFWIHQAEVTNLQYSRCVESGKCTPPAKEPKTPYWYSQPARVEDPVVGVTWYQAQEYCEFIDARLPSEAEWEKTARGSDAKPYPWGDTPPNCSLLNYDECLEPAEPDKVRSYDPGASEYKALDMAGNVFEWVSDWYQEDYYQTSPASNPLGPETGIYKVFRGGGYLSNSEKIAPDARYFTEPIQHSADLGFRCVLLGDYSDGSENNHVPRPCEVLPVNNDQPQNQPTWTPMPCQPASITSSCVRNANGGAQTSITISQGGCQVNLLDDFSSNIIGNLVCNGPNSIGDYNNYICTGSNMIQGANVDISYCHLYSVGQIVPQCPVGYVYDPYSRFCLPGGPWLPEPPCPINYVEEGGQCLPDVAVYQGCPVGFYYLVVPTGPTTYDEMCYPLDDCLLPNATQPCSPPVCPTGQTYDQANDCCSVPEKLREVCPAGFYARYDPNSQRTFCDLPNLYEVDCESRNVTIGYCPTFTPTPTATPPSNICTRYPDEKSCESHGCTWIDSVSVPPHCE